MSAVLETQPLSEIEISQHADNRWGERAPPHATDVRSALKASSSVDHVVTALERTDDPHDETDDIRLYHGVTSHGTEYSMLFIIGNNVLITTYPFDGSGDKRVDAYIETMCEQTVIYE